MLTTQHVTGHATLMAPAKADELAAQLSAEDADLLYIAKHCPKGTGQSFVQIFDAHSDEFIGNL